MSIMPQTPTYMLYQSVMYILNKVNLTFENMFPLCDDVLYRLDVCEMDMPLLINKRYDYRELEFFCYSMMHQLQYLEKNNCTLYSLEPKYCYELNKIDANGNKTLVAFVYSLLTPTELSIISGNYNYDSDVCNEYVTMFDAGGYVTRYLPLIKKTPWMDPFIISQSKLPFIYHYKTVYYSLAMIILEFTKEDFKKLIGTKLYYFIKHCRIGTPSKRIIFL
jgi:hypothetical protein